MEETREHSPMMKFVLSSLIAAFLFLPASVGAKTDGHAGYYYPKPKKVETYRARAKPIPNMNRKRRINFVTGVMNENIKRPYAPEFVIFAKGSKADKLIIVSTRDHQLNTIYRVRAMLAALTAVSRNLPFMQEYEVADLLNFFDLAKMLGFKQVTVSDGDTFTHQVILK